MRKLKGILPLSIVALGVSFGARAAAPEPSTPHGEVYYPVDHRADRGHDRVLKDALKPKHPTAHPYFQQHQDSKDAVDWIVIGSGEDLNFIPVVRPEVTRLKEGELSHSTVNPLEELQDEGDAWIEEIDALPAPTPIPEKALEQQLNLESIEEELEPHARTGEDLRRENREQPVRINFRDVSIIEYMKFISRLTGRNFIFDEGDLQFNVSVLSEEPSSPEDIMAALLQELRIHGLSLIEQGNNLIIHQNPSVTGISRVATEPKAGQSEIVTQVFKLNAADANALATVISPLVSASALVSVVPDTNHIVVTDLARNITEVANLVAALDSPVSGMVIGQYVVQSSIITTLIALAEQVMRPVSATQPITFIPNNNSNTIFIVSTPFLVEKTLAVLQHLDDTQGKTGVFDMNQLKYDPDKGKKAAGTERLPGVSEWELDENGNRIYRPRGEQLNRITPPTGRWIIDENGQWRFIPGAATGEVSATPRGRWVLDKRGNWVFQLDPTESLYPEKLGLGPGAREDLPIGHVEKIQFSLYKLQYRNGEQVQNAMKQIGDSLRQSTAPNQELIDSIDTVNWIESSNALVFTGTPAMIEKLRELIAEIDTPLRQVFIEILVLDTTMTDSLNYGVDWATQFGGGDWSGSQASFEQAIAPPSPLFTAVTAASGVAPVASAVGKALQGYHLGIIGRNLTHNGTHYGTIGALVHAIHQRGDNNIIMNPKIIVEDNTPAEIFVGINTSFQTNAVSNDTGTIITSNFEFRDVGTTLKVTPHLGNNDIVTLEIDQEISNTVTNSDNLNQGTTGTAAGATTGNISQTSPGPTTSKNRTKTRVHVPNKYFLILSGMIHGEKEKAISQVPCLGATPFLGAAFRDQKYRDQKRNLMIFVRPMIIDTQDEINDLTRHQQDIFINKSKVKKTWKYEAEGALDFFNVKHKGYMYPDCENLEGEPRQY